MNNVLHTHDNIDTRTNTHTHTLKETLLYTEGQEGTLEETSTCEPILQNFLWVASMHCLPTSPLGHYLPIGAISENVDRDPENMDHKIGRP